MRDVVRERAERRRSRQDAQRLTEHESSRVAARHQARRRRLDVALHAGDLAGEEEVVASPHLPRVAQDVRPVDVRVAVDHPEPHELGILESGNEPQDTSLLAPLHLRLEADEAEVVARKVVLSELHAGVRLAPGARIGQAHRLHRPEPQRVDAAARHHLDRQAPLEEFRIVKFVQRRLLGRHHRGVKFCVLFPVHRTVQIVALAIVDATAAVGGHPT